MTDDYHPGDAGPHDQHTRTSSAPRIAEQVTPPLNDSILRVAEVVNERFQPRFNTVAAQLAEAVDRSPMFDAMTRISEQLQTSPMLEALQGLLPQIDRRFSQLLVDLYESPLLDEYWAEREIANPEHPPPVLYVVATLPAVLGRPLYEAVKSAQEEKLLDVLEPVLTEKDFLQDLEAAVVISPHASQVAKEHLITALHWMTERRYVNAYPPFYNGLESALFAVARDRGLINDENHFLVEHARTKRATKVEDLFEHLRLDPRYRRYLRAWIFGDRGNPFRHGDVDDVRECRRQSLRLQVALIGWLEAFAGWDDRGFRRALEESAWERVGPATLPRDGERQSIG